jgi:zinc transporter 1
MTFGWGRAQTVGGLINSVFLISMCISLTHEALHRLVVPEHIEEPRLFMAVGGIGLIVNLVGLFVFKNHNHNANEEGVYLHIVGDTLGSAAVMLSATAVAFSDATWTIYLDPLVSIGIVIFLISEALRLLIRTAKEVLEGVPDGFQIEDCKTKCGQVDGVLDIPEMHVWGFGGKDVYCQMKVAAKSRSDSYRVMVDLQKIVSEFGVYDCNIYLLCLDDFGKNLDDEVNYAEWFKLDSAEKRDRKEKK